MTDKSTSEPEPLDLVVRARKGTLSAREAKALTDVLATSASVRVAYEVGSDLDRVSRVRPGDEALLERALARAFAGRPPIRRRRRPIVAVALAATLTLASAAAATRQVIVWRAESEARAAESTRVAAGQQPISPGTRRGSSPVAEKAEAVAEPEASAAPVPLVIPEPTPAQPAPASAGSSAASPQRTTAASLFRDAGGARRAGDFARARALYIELEQRFPGSSEARVSRVSLGKLYLSSGNPRDAEVAFAQYLRSGAGDLRAEALVGRADALEALGRIGEERSVRQELLRRFPASVYANRARERIAEIDGVRSR